jgi:alpha/beta superfamily hydrolase
VQGTADDIVAPAAVQKLIEKLKQQKAITIDQAIIEGGDHFFEGKLDQMIGEVNRYLDKRLS